MGGAQRRCYTYIDDAIECIYRVIENRSDVCNRQIFNIGTPQNEISIRSLAETMMDIYKEEFWDGKARLPEIVSVRAEEFYGQGYEDSDRRIPDITKVRNLLGWEPKWRMRDLLKATMKYYVNDYIRAYRTAAIPKRNVHDIVHRALQG